MSRPGGLGRGSSPLARGLPLGMWVHRVGDGIIPARAGFTRGRCRAYASTQDHPRSRGVYDSRRRRSGRRKGSSPLARGLRPARAADRADPRIIPARAGFTDSKPGGIHDIGDHPRSRGVYEAYYAAVWLQEGSSPLARGLPHRPPQGLVALGIIPARAGFTTRGRCPATRCRDHPRSRGVYPFSSCATYTASGSSPLARGLHDGALAP